MTRHTSNWKPPRPTRFHRRKLYLRHLLVKMLFVRRGFALQTLGNRDNGCSWDICPDGLNKDSVVYSGGVGNDVSFERLLVEQFGCAVHLFDPSPTGVKTMQLPENLNPQFRFSPVGLSGENGTLRFAPPLFSDEGSWYSNSDRATIEVPCRDLTTLLKENSHLRIDLLKLDIEGAEYGVINHLLDQKLNVRQILVEYHHDLLPGYQLRDAIKSGARLMRAGYKLLAEVGNNYTFFKP